MADEYTDSDWYDLLMHGRVSAELALPGSKQMQSLFKRMPAHLRCRICNVPFDGRAGRIASITPGSRPSSFSMSLCRRCEVKARGDKTGAEVELATVFADIRGSSRLVNEMSAHDYRDLIDEFYRAATDVLVERHAIIEKLVGDQVAAVFVPGLAGEAYARSAIESARELRQAFGGETDEAWVPVGIGVHAGTAFVGVVGTLGGLTELTVLGDVPNVTARLAGVAAAGEILVTEEAYAVAEIPQAALRPLDLRGRSEPVNVAALAS